MTALLTVPVGVLVERRKAQSQWVDYLWRPTEVLLGQPATPPWTLLSKSGDVATYYAGTAHIELYRTETANYRDNLTAGGALWVVLRHADGEPPFTLFVVTADPAEGEAFTEAGNDLVECVPMPKALRDTLAAFIADQHVEQPVIKRQRQAADPEALARRERRSGK